VQLSCRGVVTTRALCRKRSASIQKRFCARRFSYREWANTPSQRAQEALGCRRERAGLRERSLPQQRC
jgi:hypothetical protein